ncbi:NADH-cytochrome b5 reductase [Gymnopus androsaceus JB14]|uniref:NADH-cytochrome b5 reductase n=1 Tax=Gymnopus androsaceus JB14 TaxID=1447944 RepID=A0A6A4IJV0_9AGAR|nr:NADH-cytochrome b5 reductase [Gymnopus androsaceus JB14]
MPNTPQYFFLASFVLTFSLLFFIQSQVSKFLASKDIKLVNLLLLGLPKDPQHPEMGSHSIQDFVKNLSQEDAIALVQTPAFLASAGLVAVTVIYLALFTGKRKPVLNPSEWREFPLALKSQISPNTAVYRFSLPNKNDTLGLPIGQHIQVSAEIGGKVIMRSYTPTTLDGFDKGHFDLLIKTYEQGNISRHFSLLKVGDRIRVKGPKGAFVYTNKLTGHLGMIAGGTGITPMYQIIRSSVWDASDATTINLIYANVNEEDILLRDELEHLHHNSAGRFNIFYVLNNPPAGWKGGVGFVTKEQVAHYMPSQEKDCKILMCGPPPMMNAMKKHLEELKYPAPRTVSKLADQVFLF